MADVRVKVCDDCNLKRPMALFPLDKTSPDGRGKVCGGCKYIADKRKAKR